MAAGKRGCGPPAQAEPASVDRAPPSKAVAALAGLRKFVLTLPEVAESPHFDYDSFRVRGKIFVTVPPEGGRAHLFLLEPARELALAMHPECVEKLLWGGKVVGLRLRLDAVPPAVLRALVRQAWEHKAPKSLLGRA